MSTEAILDYDQLVEAYSANLDVTLRGFRPAEAMLDTWVPDDDLLRSLSSLVEAAQLCGSDAVAVRVATATLGPETATTLTDKLGTLGVVTLTPEPAALVLRVSQLQHTAAFRSVRPGYQTRLRARAAALCFRRPLPAGENDTPLRATEEGWALALAVNAGHQITAAAWDGPAAGPLAAALDTLCGLLRGLPLQEARDHGLVRLEYALREPQAPHAINGIILPQNADPLFRLPALLLQRLFADYQTSTGYRETPNFFDPGVAPDWAALAPAQRVERVQAALASAPGLEAGDVEVVDCTPPYAATVRFGDRLTIPAKRALALRVERLARQACDPRLEIFCEEKKDLSKLRRLT